MIGCSKEHDAFLLSLKPGDPVVARFIGPYNLTEGRQYIALDGLEPGVFDSRPYISVRDDGGRVATAYAYRFTKPE